MSCQLPYHAAQPQNPCVVSLQNFDACNLSFLSPLDPIIASNPSWKRKIKSSSHTQSAFYGAKSIHPWQKSTPALLCGVAAMRRLTLACVFWVENIQAPHSFRQRAAPGKPPQSFFFLMAKKVKAQPLLLSPCRFASS
jgi:hypothetical protein